MGPTSKGRERRKGRGGQGRGGEEKGKEGRGGEIRPPPLQNIFGLTPLTKCIYIWLNFATNYYIDNENNSSNTVVTFFCVFLKTTDIQKHRMFGHRVFDTIIDRILDSGSETLTSTSPHTKPGMGIHGRGVRVYPYPRVYPTRPVPAGTGRVG